MTCMARWFWGLKQTEHTRAARLPRACTQATELLNKVDSLSPQTSACDGRQSRHPDSVTQYLLQVAATQNWQPSIEQAHLQHCFFEGLICITLRAAARCFVESKESLLQLVNVQVNRTSLPAGMEQKQLLQDGQQGACVDQFTAMSSGLDC